MQDFIKLLGGTILGFVVIGILMAVAKAGLDVYVHVMNGRRAYTSACT